MESEVKNNHKGSLKEFISVVVAFLAIFLFAPFFREGFYAHLVMQGCFTLLFLAILYTVWKVSRLLTLGIILILLFLVFDLISVLYNSIPCMLIGYFFYTSFLILSIVVIAKNVFTDRHVNTNILFGAFIVYFLLGLFWGNLYYMLYLIKADSFHGLTHLNMHVAGLKQGYLVHFDLLYYSFTVLTTLGIGDITPMYHLAKSLTVIEAVLGQLFVATVIAKLATSWRY